METESRTDIVEMLRNITIGSYTVDHGSHCKHVAVAPICQDAAREILMLRGIIESMKRATVDVEEIERLRGVLTEFSSSVIAALSLAEQGSPTYKILNEAIATLGKTPIHPLRPNTGIHLPPRSGGHVE